MAGAAAAAERGLLRLLQRLETEREQRSERKADGTADGDIKAAVEVRRQRRQLISDLEELSVVWIHGHGSGHGSHGSQKGQELVQNLGRHLQTMTEGRAQAVRAFVPLQEDVKQRMLTSTTALNSWLSQCASTPFERLSESALEAAKQNLLTLESTSYLHCCYRWVGDANLRIRFLLSLALVLQTIMEKAATANGEQSEAHQLAEKLCEQFFLMESKKAENSKILSSWLQGRMARYDRSWRQAVRVVATAGFAGELRRRLGRAIEDTAKAEWLDLPPWPMDFPVAQAMTSFVAEYVAPTAPGTKSGSEQQRLAECPEHTLHPAALLQILYDLKEPFEVRENEDGSGSVGAVRLTEHWASLKDLPDKPPPAAIPVKPVLPSKTARAKAKAAKAAKVAKAAKPEGSKSAPKAKAASILSLSTVTSVNNIATVVAPNMQMPQPQPQAPQAPQETQAPQAPQPPAESPQAEGNPGKVDTTTSVEEVETVENSAVLKASVEDSKEQVEAKEGQDKSPSGEKRSRSRSDSASLQPKLLKAPKARKKAGAKAETKVDTEVSSQPEVVEVEPNKVPEKAEKGAEKTEKSEKAEKGKIPMQYHPFYQMWGPMGHPGHPMGMMARPPMGHMGVMMPPGMPYPIPKKRKEKKTKDKDREKRDRRDDRREESSQSSQKKKKEKKEKKKEKKEKTEKKEKHR